MSSLKTFSTLWTVALVFTASSGFPQGNIESANISTNPLPTSTSEPATTVTLLSNVTETISTVSSNGSIAITDVALPTTTSSNSSVDATTINTTEKITETSESRDPTTTAIVPNASTSTQENTETITSTLAPSSSESVLNGTLEDESSMTVTEGNITETGTEVGTVGDSLATSSIRDTTISSTLHKQETSTTALPGTTTDTPTSTTLTTTSESSTQIASQGTDEVSTTQSLQLSTTPSKADEKTTAQIQTTTLLTSVAGSDEEGLENTEPSTSTQTTVSEETAVTEHINPVKTKPKSVDDNVSASVKADKRYEDLQYQIYAVCGSFGIISLLLIVLIIVLAASISKLRDQVSSTRHVPYIPDNRTGDQIHAYDNSAFSTGHEMQERRRTNLDTKEPTKQQSYGTQNGSNPYERDGFCPVNLND